MVASDGDIAESALTAPPSSASTHLKPVRTEVANWVETSSMTPHSLGSFGYPRSSAPIPASLAVEAGQLNNKVADVVPVVPSPTERPLFMTTPPVFVPGSLASIIAPVVVTPDVTPDVAPDVARDVVLRMSRLFFLSCNVAPVTVSTTVAPTTVSCDVALVIAPFTTSSGLPPTIPVLQTFRSSPLALSASAPWSLNRPASVIASIVALQNFCSRLVCCDARCIDFEDLYVSRALEGERLMATVQSLTGQVTVLGDQNAQRQQRLDSREDQIRSLQRRLAHDRARLSVSDDALSGKTHECDQ